jgi:hypothetical protein
MTDDDDFVVHRSEVSATSSDPRIALYARIAELVKDVEFPLAADALLNVLIQLILHRCSTAEGLRAHVEAAIDTLVRGIESNLEAPDVVQ